MPEVVISGTGLYDPPHSISNEELVATFNEHVRRFNAAHRRAIDAGEIAALAASSADFIQQASGIQRRRVVDRDGILDPEIMAPRLRERSDDEPSLMCEMALGAAGEALGRAGKRPADVDCVLVAASNLERPYPALAIEVQDRLGAGGFAYDLNVACSSATFAIQAAGDALRAGNAGCALVVSPEICTGHLNFRDRDSHFIFGDACTAVVVERAATRTAPVAFQILGAKLTTRFSNNIRNNFGFLNRASPEGIGAPDKLFVQDGRRVFREVVPLVSDLISSLLKELGLKPADVRRMWLHQANLNMNRLIARRAFGRGPTPQEAPVILDEYANTSSAGSIIAFHKHQDGLVPGDIGILCAFGAGYSAGAIALQRV